MVQKRAGAIPKIARKLFNVEKAANQIISKFK